jgi:hypothetical protein
MQHPLAAVIDHDEREITLAENLADGTADATEPDDDRVVVNGGVEVWGRHRDGRRRALERREQAGARIQPGAGPVCRPERERVEADREDGGRHEKALSLGRQEPEARAERGEDEGELSDLREAGRDREGGSRGVAEGEDDEERGDRLPEHHDEHDQHDGERPIGHPRG